MQVPIEQQHGKYHTNADLRPLIEVLARACKTDLDRNGHAALAPVLHAFELEREQRRFVPNASNMRIPPETREFAINVSVMRHCEAPTCRHTGELQQESIVL